jgi:hypothetical protein
MKPKIGTVLVWVALVAATQARATTLPDACGNDEVKFNVTTQKAQPAAVAPEAGKATIILVETMETPYFRFWSHRDVTTRFGVDGAWVGANQGNSYFTLAVDPGEHHLCVNWQSVSCRLKQKVGLASFSAEPGKIYYYQAKVTLKPVSNNYSERSLELTPLDEDNGKYRVKISGVSTAIPRS